MIFGIKEKWIILTHTMYFWLLLQICALLMTAFVLQGHIYSAALDVMYFHLNVMSCSSFNVTAAGVNKAVWVVINCVSVSCRTCSIRRPVC